MLWRGRLWREILWRVLENDIGKANRVEPKDNVAKVGCVLCDKGDDCGNAKVLGKNG